MATKLAIDDGKKCAICQDSETHTAMQALPCAHTFHELCINNWLKIKSRCPICRYRISRYNFNEETEQQDIVTRIHGRFRGTIRIRGLNENGEREILREIPYRMNARLTIRRINSRLRSPQRALQDNAENGQADDEATDTENGQVENGATDTENDQVDNEIIDTENDQVENGATDTENDQVENEVTDTENDQADDEATDADNEETVEEENNTVF